MTNSSSNSRRRRAWPFWRKVGRSYVLIVLGSLLAFDLGFYLLAVRPLGAREQKQQALVSTLAQQIRQKTEDVKRLGIVVVKVERARSEGDALLDEITLVRRTTYSTVVAELVEAAAVSGIETRDANFDLDPVEGAEQYGVITITANFRGEYENLVKLLNRMDRSDYFLILESLGATPRADSSDLQIAMKLDVFVREL